MLRLRKVHPSDVYSLVHRSQRRRDKRRCCKVVFVPSAEKLFFIASCFVVKYSMKSACVHSIAITNVIRIQVLLSLSLCSCHTHTHTHKLTVPCRQPLLSPCFQFKWELCGDSVPEEEALLMLLVDDTL